MPKKQQPLRAMGMDLSPTGSALVTLEQASPKAEPTTVSMLLLNRGKANNRAKADQPFRGNTIENLLFVASSIGHELQQRAPMLVMLEDYSGGGTANAFTLACTGEVTGPAKLWMKQLGFEWCEVAASTLKKFVTGVGKGKKDVMWLGAYKRWRVEHSTLLGDDNVLDAYCLARMGLAMLWARNGHAMTKAEAECFKKVRRGGASRLKEHEQSSRVEVGGGV